ncbi:TPA: hypothetical protein JRX02_002907 [Elizabethkingia anophelis]|uniref:hypothetical protein n=1 Tax=Elizabethkingia anophelis TaxID=1117645 RepID=UPI0004658975|nr:hypothetical protein [Elizabethkingia anophelis]ELB0069476.1 hypothetical protein [Elizabethkingia anophelis]ELB1894303.1 hypothetical protein [Elizabethkingia anophelis]MCT3669689.1 hypothetical protein [Elizabethkingia anophelis]MCT3674434.1 hypothetical protein [Elizabethkingia anophelis]MCT3682085.1 hypothetical protein [Elizabethkingia anophelis]
MNNIKKFNGSRQKVVFDSMTLATYPGGVIIDNVDAKARFTDGIIPAGAVVVPSDGKFKIVNADLTATNIKGAIGLVLQDVAIEDFTQSSVVMDATVRIVALPDKEQAGAALLAKELPSLKFI